MGKKIVLVSSLIFLAAIFLSSCENNSSQSIHQTENVDNSITDLRGEVEKVKDELSELYSDFLLYKIEIEDKNEAV